MEMAKKIADFVKTWTPAWRIGVSIIIVSATVSTIYARIDNRLDRHNDNIKTLQADSKEIKDDLVDFKTAIAAQTTQLENICKALERIERQLERLDIEKKDK